MSELLIIRHAIAHERDPSSWPNDDERPLTKQGIDRFHRAARGLRRIADAPDELLCSPLVRARQTAAILEEKAGFPAPIELQALRPGADVAATIRALQERAAARIALVGHEPDLSQLIAVLLGGLAVRVAVEMKKGAVAQLAFAARIDPGAGTLRALLPPRVLRAL